MSKEEAIKRAGSLTKLASLLGITPAAVCQWKVIPKSRVWQLKVLKPDWFDAD
jgi:DNA-binding transcriptional regulator YdaS (Cro superfamily)